MKIEKITAIANLVPNGNFEIIGDTIISHRGKIVPSEAEIQTEIDRLEKEFTAQEYARNREAEYGALNQLEMQFDDKEDGTTTWEDAIKAIKMKWPKDNSGPKPE